jgi:hypothetical protein
MMRKVGQPSVSFSAMRAARRAQITEQAAQQRRFAHAVAPDDGERRALRQRERYVAHDDRQPVPAGEIFDRQFHSAISSQTSRSNPIPTTA